MDHLLSIAIASLAAAISPALAMAVFILAFGGQLFNPWVLVFLLAIAAIALAYTVLFGWLTVGWLIQRGRFRARPRRAAGWSLGLCPLRYGSIRRNAGARNQRNGSQASKW